MAEKRFSLWLCILAVTLGFLLAPAAFAMTLEESPAEPQENVYQITLDAGVIGDRETLSYETVAPAFAGNPFAADYYPGALTVELTGPIVIESGGCLTVGTLSSGNENELSPVLRGELSPGGLVVVKPGGRLVLKNVTLELTGEGLFVVQEPGGSVELSDMEPEDGLFAWVPATVDNTYQSPRDVWLEEGVLLTKDLLPAVLETNLLDKGTQQWTEFALSWDLSEYRDQTDGELTATGSFLDKNGDVLPSVRPLTLTVHWYKPQELVVTNSAWLGETAASAKLVLMELPADATEVWGEVSPDEESWERWEDFQYREGPSGGINCVFSLPDSTPQYFRVRAADQQQHLYWVSNAVLLPQGETTDQGGNRGGSVAVIPHDREPEPPEATPTPTPTPKPTPTPTPAPTSEPTPTPAPTPTPKPTPPPESTPAPTPMPVPSETVEPTPGAEVTAPPTPEATILPTDSAAVAAESVIPPAEPSPETAPSPAQQPTSSAAPASDSAAVTSEPAPTAEPSPTPSPAVPPAPTPTAEITPVPEKPEPPARELPMAAQLLWVAAGAAVCAGVGIFTARRKRK